MTNFYRYNKYLYRVLQIFIGIDIINKCKHNILNLLIFFGLYLVIVANDYLREKVFYKSIKRYYLSMAFTMIMVLVLEIKVDGYIDIYAFTILHELILYTEGKLSKIFISLGIASLLILILFRVISAQIIYSVEFWKENMLDTIMGLVWMFFYLLILFGYKALRKEKREVDRLNKELELSYNKLKDQSEKIEELTITKERNRVAGEIHDNLGHGLIALNMNLDVAGKIMDKDHMKAKELIQKSQELTKKNMENLRKAVYALKEDSPRRFRTLIKEVIKDIESTGSILVYSNIPEEIENLLPEYKEIVYSVVKESLTNSIKHGKANEIDINIEIGEEIKVIIRDNGMGCEKLTKGNGLLGIENKIKDYNGKVSFDYNKEGFQTTLTLK